METVNARLTRRQQEVRNALVKKTFEVEEERYLLNLIDWGSCHPTWMEENPLAVVLPIAMLALPDLREAVAVRWVDLEQNAIINDYHFRITQFLADDGTLRQVFDRSPERCRCVPVAKPLEKLLLSYKAFLMEKYNLSEEQLAMVPIILDDHAHLKKCKLKVNHCNPRVASRIINEYISRIGIQPYIVNLPNGSEERITDLNHYEGNIFRTNLRHRLRHLCRFTDGEINYILGLKAPDTFSAHYCA